MSELELRVPLQPKQLEFYKLAEDSEATWIGYGGSRGGAKSHALRAAMLLRRLSYPRTGGLILRRTYEQVRENHIEPLFRQYPFMREWFHTQNKALTLPNGSVIQFGSAENKGDVYSFQGQEFMDIGTDEATLLHQEDIEFLKTCNRWPGMPDRKCKMLMTMNPGGVGHAFIKRVFFERHYHENEKAEDYAFLQAYAWDNVEWSRSALAEAALSDKQYYSWTDEQRFEFFLTKTDYGRSLDRLPKSLRIGHLLGRWDIFAGQYFDCFDPAIHTAPAARIKLESWWPRWISIDWGFRHPCAVYWHAKDGDRVITYREICEPGIDEPVLAQRIVDASKADTDSLGRPIPIQHIFISPDAKAKRGSANTIKDQIGEVLQENGLPYPADADDARVAGWRLCYEMLKANLILISQDCLKLIQCLPALMRDDEKREDAVKFDADEKGEGGDDPADAWRYGLKSMLGASHAPLEVRIQERLADFAETRNTTIENLDPHVIATMSRRAERLERGRFKHGHGGRIWHPQSTGR